MAEITLMFRDTTHDNVVRVYVVSTESGKAAFAEDIAANGISLGLVDNCWVNKGTQDGREVVSVCRHFIDGKNNMKNVVFPFATTAEKAAFAVFLITDFTVTEPYHNLLHADGEARYWDVVSAYPTAADVTAMSTFCARG